MDDSPRSAKRRKIETPTKNVSSPRAKGTLKRVSGRLAARATSLAASDTLEENTSPVLPPQTAKSVRKIPNRTPNAATRRRPAEKDKDIYDDFEGALQEKSPAPQIRGSRRTARRKNVNVEESLKPHPFKGAGDKLKPLNPRLDELGNKAPNLGSWGAGGHEASESEAQGDSEPHVATPTRRKATPRTTKAAQKISVRKPKATPATRWKTGRAAGPDEPEPDAPQLNGSSAATPSRAPPAKGRSAVSKNAARPDIVAEDDHDELGPATPSRSSKGRRIASAKQGGTDQPEEIPKEPQSTRARRGAHQVDHTYNRDDVTAVPDTEDLEIAIQLNGGGENLLDNDGESILDPTEPSPFNPKPSVKDVDATGLLAGDLVPGRELDLLKKIVMERITGKRPSPLVGLDEEYKTVHQLVEHTVTAGEGNSILLIGARGSGKTTLVNKVLLEVSKDNAEEFHIVRLNGFIHTDDKIALREIWRQLGKEMDIEDDNIGKNYADTLTTLLALLSHPSEHTGEETEQVAKAVIFVMDEFDLFASHPRQTLLYNLFDIAQSRKAPIAVLGLTTRIDVANSLEKRVKSRFSHRYVHLSLAKTFTAFQEICKASLIVQSDQLSIEERAILCSTPNATPNKKSKKPSQSQSILAEWNSNITSLFASQSFLTTTLAPYYHLIKSPTVVLTTFLLPTSTLSPFSPPLLKSLAPPKTNLTLLPHLSTLQLSLLIAAARLDIIHDSDTCNFNMAYDEYVSLASKARIASAAGGAVASGSASKVWGKEVARRAWEGLLELGLVMSVGGGGTAGAGFAMVKCDVGLEEIGAEMATWVGGDKTLERWCKQL